MKAMVYREYGSPANLRLEDRPLPQPGKGEVRLKVAAASINSWDMDLVRGEPFLSRAEGGLKRPRREILGCDVAGIVDAVGEGAGEFVPGDRVFGDLSSGGWGGFAEYVAADAAMLAHIPDGLTWEEAAALPQAGVLALQALRQYGVPAPGSRLLINGAGGGVGTLLIQLARQAGIEVAAVDGASKLARLRELGAEKTIDYRAEDFTASGERWEKIVDVTARRPLLSYARALNRGGSLVIIGGSGSLIIRALLFGRLAGLKNGNRLGLLMHRPNRTDLEELSALCVAGTIRPVIDRRFPLEELPAAFDYFGRGEFIGKVVVRTGADT